MESNTEEGEHSTRLTYSGSGNALAFIMFTNIILTVLTLGIYSAWGRTNVRRFTWGETSFMGDRVTYTGQGKELFIGWIILIAIYAGFYAAIKLLSEFISPLILILALPLYYYLYALVIYGGTRYRISRTNWRSVHFGLDKNKALTRQFIWLVFKSVFLTIITLGIYFPYLRHNIRKFLTDKTHFGTAYFKYEGNAGEYALLFHKGVLLSFLTLGIYIPWFMVNLLRYRMEKTTFQNAGFKIHLVGKDLFVYSFASLLLSLVTLGIATPWILNWGNKIILNSIEVVGELNLEQIQNVASTGEALADIAAVEYDIDLAF